MKNEIKILDKYFEEARNNNALFPISHARSILDKQIATNASQSKNLWNRIKGKPMNIITTTAAFVALVGILSLGIVDFDKQSDLSEIKQISNDNKTQLINPNEPKTNSRNDLAVASIIGANEDSKNAENIATKTSDKISSDIIIPENERVSIKGINVIQLSEEELSELGIEIIKDDSNIYEDETGKSKYGLAYCDNWINDEPVRTVVMKDWGVVRNSNWETPDADYCVSPRIITDSKGFRRIEVFNDQEDLTTKTYYNNFEDVHKDDSGNELKIKTNQTTTSYHLNQSTDVEEEIKTEVYITSDDNYSSKEPKIIVMGNNVDINEKDLPKPIKSTVLIVNIDSTNKYINKDNDEEVVRSVFIFDSNRMDDLDVKLKKFNFEWHEEQLGELKGQLEEINEQQKELQILTNPSSIKLKMSGVNFDSLTSSQFFLEDSLMNKHINIEFNTLDEIEHQCIDDSKLFFIKKFNNIERDINNFIRVNKMIPIEVPIEENGDNFSFILWFDPTPELLQKLPARVSDMLELELDALQNTNDVCQTPIKGEEAILDIWRSCNGAIENLHVFPNPTTGDASLQFNLTEPRDIRITLNDLYGRSIKSLSSFHRENAGLVKQSIDLSNLPAGMYLIAVESKNGEQAVQRIIVE